MPDAAETLIGVEPTEPATPEPVEETPAEPVTAESAEPAVESVEPTETPAQADAPAAPAIKDGDVVRYLREQSKLAPENSKMFKELQERYFRAGEYSRLFPNVDEARTLRTHLDALGGMD